MAKQYHYVVQPCPEEGQIVWVQGHKMIARNVRQCITSDGIPCCRFEGHCADDNDSIRHTGYDGGEYGWRVDQYAIEDN